MRLKGYFFLTVLFFSCFWGFSGYTANNSAEIQKIDSEILQLKEMKRGYEGIALRHETQAEYLQFNDKAVLETRRHLQFAEENRQRAALVQQEIDKLEAKKARLQK